MSSHRTTRRAMLAGAASLPAVATLGAGAALAAPGACSFPDLVAQFIQVRERWLEQTAIEKAERDQLEGLFEKARGFSFREWRALDVDDPRYRQAEAIYQTLCDDNQSHDPDC